jgi:hypothetical protein
MVLVNAYCFGASLFTFIITFIKIFAVRDDSRTNDSPNSYSRSLAAQLPLVAATLRCVSKVLVATRRARFSLRGSASPWCTFGFGF